MNKLIVKKILKLKTSLWKFCTCQNQDNKDYDESVDALASYTLELTELVQVLEKRVRELETKLPENE
nr:MAG TPA: zipper dimerization domain transcription factor-like protein [Caudoviricetes sp.]